MDGQERRQILVLLLQRNPLNAPYYHRASHSRPRLEADVHHHTTPVDATPLDANPPRVGWEPANDGEFCGASGGKRKETRSPLSLHGPKPCI